KHPRESSRLDTRSECSQTRMPDARNGAERSANRRRNRIYGDSALMSTGSIAWDTTAGVARTSLVETLHDWVTTVDHKRLGMLYVLYALLFLGLGGVEAVI